MLCLSQPDKPNTSDLYSSDDFIGARSCKEEGLNQVLNWSVYLILNSFINNIRNGTRSVNLNLQVYDILMRPYLYSSDEFLAEVEADVGRMLTAGY